MKPGSLTSATVSGIAWQSVTIGANIVLRAAILVYLTRTLSPREFGIIAAATVVINITTVLSEVGVARVLVQRPSLGREMKRSAFALALYTGSGCMLLVYAAAPLISKFFELPELVPYVRVLSVILLINSVSTVAEALVQRAHRFRRMGLIELGSFLTGFGFVALPLAQMGIGAWSLAIGYLVQSTLKMVAFWISEPPPIGFVPREGTRELIFTGSTYMVGQGGNFVARQVDYLIVGRWLGPIALGFYNRAYQFLMLPAQLFGNATAKVLFPSLASIQNDPERVSRAYLRALGVIAMWTLPATGFLLVIASELVLTLFGEGWRPMILPFQILIVSLFARTSSKIGDAVVLAMGSMGSRAWRQWIYAASVAAGAIFGAQWDLMGVSIGVSAAVVLNFVMMTQLAMSILGIPARVVWGLHARHLLISAGYTAVILAIVTTSRAEGLADAAVLAIATVSAIILALALWFGARPVFGKDGEWLATLVHSRLPFMRLRGGPSRVQLEPGSHGAVDSPVAVATEDFAADFAVETRKRRKVDLDMAKAKALSTNLGLRLANISPPPDLAIGLANGGIVPATFAAQAFGIECSIVKVRRKSSQVKQRMRLVRPLLSGLPRRLVRKSGKKIGKAVDSWFPKVNSEGLNSAIENVAGRHVVIIDDCIDSGASIAHVRKRLLAQGAATVSIAVITWATKFDSLAAHGVAPDIYLNRTIDRYPWAIGSDHYDEFVAWLVENDTVRWT